MEAMKQIIEIPVNHKLTIEIPVTKTLKQSLILTAEK
jgi:hypothetical protein